MKRLLESGLALAFLAVARRAAHAAPVRIAIEPADSTSPQQPISGIVEITAPAGPARASDGGPGSPRSTREGFVRSPARRERLLPDCGRPSRPVCADCRTAG